MLEYQSQVTKTRNKNKWHNFIDGNEGKSKLSSLWGKNYLYRSSVPQGPALPTPAPRGPAEADSVAACPGGASPVEMARGPAPPRPRALRLPPLTF